LQAVVRLLALVLLCALAGAAAPASATADDDPAALRIVVKRRAGLDAAERAALRAGADVTLDHRLSLDGVEVVRADPGERGAAPVADGQGGHGRTARHRGVARPARAGHGRGAGGADGAVGHGRRHAGRAGLGRQP